jgi:hypothetical protein
MIKMVKTCPVNNNGVIYREKATIAMFTALSMISIDIRIIMALRFARAP